MSKLEHFSVKKLGDMWYQSTCLVNKATAVGHGVTEEDAISDCKKDIEVIKSLLV